MDTFIKDMEAVFILCTKNTDRIFKANQDGDLKPSTAKGCTNRAFLTASHRSLLLSAFA